MAKRKPTDKPYPDFPLFKHATGQWAKKVRGKLHYFGTDAHEALKRYQEVRDDIHAGRTPRPRSGELTVAELVNTFLTLKRSQVDSGDITARSWAEYHAACESLVESVGRNRIVVDLAPDDFAKLRTEKAKRLGPISLCNFIQRIRTVFKFGFDSGLLDVPIRFGQGFDKPPKRVQRLQRALAGRKLITAVDAWRLIQAAGSPLDAMILLGLNCGFGQGDCSELPRRSIDARPGWVDFARPKTGIGRRAPLWPETVAALDRARANRPAPRDPADDRLVFLTTFGRPWVRFSDKGDEKRGARTDAVGLEFAKLCKRVGVKLSGGFYVLRHTFRTVADAVKDHAAIGLVMGHHDDSMAGYYREHIADDRLRAVTDHVRAWLMAGKDAAEATPVDPSTAVGNGHSPARGPDPDGG